MLNYQCTSRKERNEGRLQDGPLVIQLGASLPGAWGPDRRGWPCGHWHNRVWRCRGKQASEIQLHKAEEKAWVAVIIVFITQFQAARELGSVCAKKCEAYPAYGDLGLGRKGCGTPSLTGWAPLSAACFSQSHVSIGLPKPARTSDQG